MQQKSRIVVPTGAEPVEPPPAPHFDREATRAARPVVPLAPDALESSYNTNTQTVVKMPAPRRAPWILVFVVIAAGLSGAAGALAIDFFKSHQRAALPEAAPPATADVRPAPKPVEEIKPATDKAQTPPAPPVIEMSKTAEQPALSPVVSPPVTAKEKAPDAARPRPSPVPTRERPAPQNPTTNNTQASSPPVAPREKPQADRKPDERDNSGQKTQPRRKPVDQIKPEEIPQQIKRTREGVNRIREIFEGRQP